MKFCLFGALTLVVGRHDRTPDTNMAFQVSTENISIQELVNHGTL